MACRQQGINILGSLRVPCGCATPLVFLILLHIHFYKKIEPYLYTALYRITHVLPIYAFLKVQALFLNNY